MATWYPKGMGARRWFSLTGVIPLGFFLLEHVWMSAAALRGQSAYVAAVESLTHVPLLGVLELLLVILPLLYHAAYGLWTLRKGLAHEPGPLGRTLAITNRSAAVVTLLFIAWHVVEYRLPLLRGTLAPVSLYDRLVYRMSSIWHAFPVRAFAYLVGILATAFHFAASTWSWTVSSELVSTGLEKRRAAWGLGVIASLVFVTAAATVVSLATGWQLEPKLVVPPCGP